MSIDIEAFEGAYHGYYDLIQASEKQPPCQHERLDEDGICRKCGKDCRGV